MPNKTIYLNAKNWNRVKDLANVSKCINLALDYMYENKKEYNQRMKKLNELKESMGL